MQPSREVIETLNAIATEVGAGKSFSCEPDAVIWNNAHDRALAIIANYKEGHGLFQITGKVKPTEAGNEAAT